MTIRTSFDRIYRAMTVMEQCVDERQGTMDLTYKEMMYLYLIDLTEDCTVSKLADMINVSLPAVTKRINSLEERGLVQRGARGTGGSRPSRSRSAVPRCPSAWTTSSTPYSTASRRGSPRRTSQGSA